jgi:dTDP-4-dehydrorhamnose 3,5-epimerase
MQVTRTNLEGVLSIKLEVFRDFRGHYLETYNEKMYAEHGISAKFIQDDISVSKKNVLRGIHGDQTTWKLISCLHGSFYFVVVNCDLESKDFGRWQSFHLSDENGIQILVPPKHGNGHLVLSETTIFHYKQSTYYDPSGQFTYLWNDPRFGIDWPVKDPILSKRDTAGHF